MFRLGRCSNLGWIVLQALRSGEGTLRADEANPKAQRAPFLQQFCYRNKRHDAPLWVCFLWVQLGHLEVEVNVRSRARGLLNHPWGGSGVGEWCWGRRHPCSDSSEAPEGAVSIDCFRCGLVTSRVVGPSGRVETVASLK